MTYVRYTITPAEITSKTHILLPPLRLVKCSKQHEKEAKNRKKKKERQEIAHSDRLASKN